MSVFSQIEALKKKATEDIANYGNILKAEQVKAMQTYSKRRIYRSTIFQNKLQELEEEYHIKVEKRQDKLREDIQKLQEKEDVTDNDNSVTVPTPPFTDSYIPPYPVDITLSFQERYNQLCQHYLSYPNKETALKELDNDIFIQEYLGFYYKYLRQYISVNLP